MLDIRSIAQDKEVVIQKLKKRQVKNAVSSVEKALALNQRRKKLQGTSDQLRHEMKQKSIAIAAVLKTGDTPAAEALKREVMAVKTKYKTMFADLKATQAALVASLLDIPNLPDDDVPLGKGEQDNPVRSLWDPEGRVETLEDSLKPHWNLLAQHGLASFEQGVKIVGAGFPVYMGKGAKLQRALINFFLDEAAKAGYAERWLPIVANEASVTATGQLPDKAGQMYEIPNLGYLISTGEIPLTNICRDAMLGSADLPQRFCAYTACFRREAGSWGRNVRGLNRLHQFDKVEIVQVVTPEDTEATFHSMCTHVRTLLEKLGLTYRIVAICTGDLGFTAAKTYDFEVYAPGQQRWLEASSVSSFNDYQARRLNLRCPAPGGGKRFCHTLNGSALALPRILAALLETYQTPSGIAIPTVLHPYTTFTSID
ncbi:MAG: serine--tRNA ligase [Cytophagales bacterium]